MTELPARLADLLRRLGASADPASLAEHVVAAWSSPDRRYHDRTHLRDCLSQLDAVPDSGADRGLVEAALWFHDAIYDSRADDNEERSAAWARGALPTLGIPRAAADEVARLVLLTRHFEPASDPAGRLLSDVDLSILGRPVDQFDAYERAIGEEYAWVPAAEFRAARTRVLSALLARSPLYQTAHFRHRYESVARHNLERALTLLAHPGS